MSPARPETFDPVRATIDLAQLFVEQLLAPAALVARNGRIIVLNDKAARIAAEAPEALVGRDIIEFAVPVHRDAARALLGTATATGTPRCTTLDLVAQGVRVSAQAAAFPVRTPDGFVAGHVVIASLQQPLRRDLRMLNRVVRGQALIATFGRDALDLTSIRAIERSAADTARRVFDSPNIAMFRVERSKIQVQSLPDGPGPRNRVAPEPLTTDTVLANVVRTGQSAIIGDLSTDDRFTPSPWLADVRSVIVALVRINGRVVGGIVAADPRPRCFSDVDLTALEEIAGIISVSLERLTRSAEPFPGLHQISLPFKPNAFGTWAWNPTTDRFWLSPGAEVMVGLAPGTFGGTRQALDELIGLPPDPSGQRSRQRFALLLEAGAADSRFVDPHGNVRWIESRGYPLNHDDPDSEWVGVMFDVTDRNRLLAARLLAEEEVRVSNRSVERLEVEARSAETRLRHLVDDAPAGFGFWDSELRCLTINTQLANALDIAIPDAVGRSIAEISGPNTALATAFASVAQTGNPIEHLVVTGQSGSDPEHRHTWMYKVFPTRLDSTLTGVGAIAIDITEQKRAEHVERLFRTISENLAGSQGTLQERLRQTLHVPIPEFADVVAIAFLEPTSGELIGLQAIADDNGTTETHALDSADTQILFDHLQADPPQARPVRLAEPDNNQELLDHFDLHSAIVVTLVIDGQASGRLLLGYRNAPGRIYESRDLRIADELAYRYRDVLETTRLRDAAAQARIRVDLLARLGELASHDFATSGDLGAIADVFVPQFADACLLMIVDDDMLRAGSARAADPAVQEWLTNSWNPSTSMATDSPATNAIRSGTAGLFHRADLERMPERFASPLHEVANRTRMESGLTIPIIGTSGPIGVLLCVRTQARRGLTTEDAGLAPEIARRIVPLIESGRRLRRAQEHTEALQRSLLPAELPTIFGYTLAAQYRASESELRVGGDWYDVLELSDRSILLAIGDVAGHGALAAGLTGQLRTALRIAALDTTDVAQLLDRLDRFLHGLDGVEMTTAILIRLDRERGAITWASAGHLPPLLRTCDGTTTYLTDEVGPPLGAVPQATFTAHSTVMPPGSCLVLYTDGLVERRDESITAGLDRLATRVGEQEPDPGRLDTCAIGLMNAMTGDRAPEDDIALFVLHRAPETATSSVTIGAGPDAARRARQMVGDHLRSRGTPQAIVADCMLITSELCSNAVEHSGLESDDAIVVRCTTAADGVELSVEDAGTWTTDGPRRGGRGLQIVRDLADAVEITRTDPGTRVTVRRRFTPEPVVV